MNTTLKFINQLYKSRIQLMGNKGHKTQSVIQEEDIKIDHPKLKDMKFKKTKDREQYMEANFPIHSKNDFSKWSSDLKRDPAYQSENVLLPVKHDFQQNKLCGSGGHAKVVYENFPYLLSYQIKNRQDVNQRKFQENELWYLIHTLATVGNLYHKSGQKIGNIAPNYVFMSEGGVIKIASKNSWPGQKTNYQNALYDEQLAYLAPEQAKDLDIQKKMSDSNFQLAESFSTGLTILDSALLEKSDKLYSKRGFDFQRLEGRKQNLKNQPYYSPAIKHVILNLLEIDPKKRMTLSELKSWLGPYSDSIFNLQNFVPSNYHEKLENTARNNSIRDQNSPNQQENYRKSRGEIYHEPESVSGYLPQRASLNPQYTRNSNNIFLPQQSEERVTKTKEIHGGPTCSSRPKKKAMKSSQKNPIKQTFGWQIPNRSPANSAMQQPIQTVYQNSSTQRSSQNPTSLQMIEEKIRNSRMNFPDV